MNWEPAGKGGASTNKKRRGCLIAVAVVVVIAVVGGIARCASGGGSSKALEWPTNGLAAMLPKPDSNEGDVVINDNDRFSASIDGYTQEKFDAYVAQCQEKGFTVEAQTNTDEFDAYSEDGYHLSLRFYDSLENMDIDLEAPIEMGPMTWPSAGAGSLVPAPTSTTGKIDSDSSSFFFAYVGETSSDDYAAYVDTCSAAGFNVDYDRGDTWYSASNADGVSLRIEYRGFSTMTVKVSVPDEADAEPVTTEEPEAAQPETAQPQTTAPTADSSGVDPDFKATMDSYESFMNEYVDFMNVYNSDPNNVVGMLAEYNDMMQEYSDYMSTIDAIDESSLSGANLQYYIDVTTRVNQRLLTIGQ